MVSTLTPPRDPMAAPTSATSSQPGSSAEGRAKAPMSELQQRVTSIVMSLRFVWFLGHLMTVAGALQFVFARAERAYYIGLFGSAVAYGILVFRAFMDYVNARSPLQDAVVNCATSLNTHYLLMTAGFWFSKYPCFPLLVPLAGVSALRALGYVGECIVPVLLSGVVLPTESATRFSQVIKDTEISYGGVVAGWSAMWEISVTPVLLLLRALLGYHSHFLVLVYADFMLASYMLSTGCRAAYARLRQILDDRARTALSGRNPHLHRVANAYHIFRDSLLALDSKLSAITSNSITQPRFAPPPPKPTPTPAPADAATGSQSSESKSTAVPRSSPTE